ncbi:MAG: tRNA lysidine(34) synthetase TilS [Clostridia bacterium]|nr:tRNA lysidine(34) synthetase TilS [Clostridia bacterium]
MTLEKIKTAIEKYDMLCGGENLTVALSGGADSVCLLHALISLKDVYNIKLSAIHINHNLRGSEADRDEEFVRKFCENLNVPLMVKSVNVREIAEKSGQSIELAARNVRYNEFINCGADIVATAHTASDNTETVLFNMLRGAGLKGLCGIPAKRDIYIRPLILCTRKDVENYISENKLSYVTDSSNLSDDYSRNLLRHRAVPVLKELNPSVENTITSMCQGLKEDLDFLETSAKKIGEKCICKDGINIKELNNQHIAVVKRVLSAYFYETTGKIPDGLHIARMTETLFSGTKKSLPLGLYCAVENNIFYIEKEGNKPTKTYETTVTVKEIDKINNLLLKNIIDCDTIVGELKIRTRLEGDSIRLKGRNCTKSLKKLFSELKIPKEERDVIPVAADSEGIVWIYGIGVSKRNAVNDKTKTVAEFKTTVLGEDKNVKQ